MALGLERNLLETKEALESIRTLQGGTITDRIRIGSLFGLRQLINDSPTSQYVVVAKGGGESVEVEGEKVYSIAVQSPLARACLGKEEGDEIECNARHYVIGRIA